MMDEDDGASISKTRTSVDKSWQIQWCFNDFLGEAELERVWEFVNPTWKASCSFLNVNQTSMNCMGLRTK